MECVAAQPISSGTTSIVRFLFAFLLLLLCDANLIKGKKDASSTTTNMHDVSTGITIDTSTIVECEKHFIYVCRESRGAWVVCFKCTVEAATLTSYSLF